MELEKDNEAKAGQDTSTQNKEERRAEAIRKNKIKQTINIGAAIIFVAGLIYWSVTASQKAEEQAMAEQALLAQQANPGSAVEIMESFHIQPGAEREAYNSNPPTSGPHYARPAQWGIYSQEIPEGGIIHSLEHGGIWISYRPELDDDSRKVLESIARKHSGSVIVSPRAENDSLIAVASWGRVANMDAVDELAINAYIQFNKNNSPEKLAQ